VRTIINVTLAAALSCAPVLAQPAPQPLTLQDCIRLAQAAQSSVTVARQETEIAHFGVSRAKAAFLPQVHVNNGFAYQSPLVRGGDFSFVTLNGIREYVSQLTTLQELDISGKLRSELERARADRDATTAGLGLTQRDLWRAVTTGYYRVLLSRHLVQVAQDALAEAQSFESRTRLLSEKGEVAQADVIKASAQVAFQQQAVNAAELEAQVANHELASFWTAAVGDPLSLVDALEQPLPSLDSILGAADAPSSGPLYLKRPEFSLLDAQRRGFLADSHRARADLLSQANFAFQYGLDSMHLRIQDRGYAAFINLNIPVFDWLRTHNLSRQFQLKARQVEATRTFSKEYQDALSRVKFLALYLTHTTLNISSFMGTIMVVGIVQKNGILMLDLEKFFSAQGLPLRETIFQAGRRRLRPIVMTALATIFGMLPLALGVGSGAEMLQPLAIAVIGGAGISMILSLLITPVLFYLLLQRGL